MQSVPRPSCAPAGPIPRWRAQLSHRLRPQAAVNRRRAPASRGRHAQPPVAGVAEVLPPGLLADAALTLRSAPMPTRQSENTWALEEADSDPQPDCTKEAGRR